MTAWSSEQIQVAKNIDAIARKYGTIPSVVMLAVAIQESDLSVHAQNLADAPDYGGSVGIFQLNQDPLAHPNTAFIAQSPWYDYGYHEIQISWETAWTFFGGWGAFLRSPSWFLYQFAPKAQGSIAWTIEMAQDKLDEASYLLEVI